MTLDLGNGKHVSVDAHSGKIWLSSYNGCGVVVSLTRAEAIKLRTALLAAILELERMIS